MTGAERFQAQHGVSRETIERLEIYAALLCKWNSAINLVARSTIDDLWNRHFLDSAQLWALRPQGYDHWLDIGSGGGFPGLVVAILAAEEHPAARTSLAESDGRKAAFLRTVIREAGLPAVVHNKRVEVLEPQHADVLSARALAPLGQLLAFAERHLSPGGTAIFPKGATFEREVKEALAVWSFRVHKTPSRTDAAGVVLTIGEIARA